MRGDQPESKRAVSEPFSAQPASQNVGEQQRPALLDGPSLRDGVYARQGVAHDADAVDGKMFITPSITINDYVVVALSLRCVPLS